MAFLKNIMFYEGVREYISSDLDSFSFGLDFQKERYV